MKHKLCTETWVLLAFLFGVGLIWGATLAMTCDYMF